jgi:hypothetical protein
MSDGRQNLTSGGEGFSERAGRGVSPGLRTPTWPTPSVLVSDVHRLKRGGNDQDIEGAPH